MIQQFVEDFHGDRLTFDLVSEGLGDVQQGKLHQQLADLHIRPDLLRGERFPRTVKMIIVEVGDECPQVSAGEMNDQDHGKFFVAEFVQMVGINDDKFPGDGMVLLLFDDDGRVAVQNIDQLDGGMPVHRIIFLPIGIIMDLDADLVVFENRLVHMDSLLFCFHYGFIGRLSQYMAVYIFRAERIICFFLWKVLTS